jgi:hypothetical protein
MEVSGKLHAPAVLTAGKRTCYPLNTRLSGPQSLSGSGDERNSQPLPGLELSIIQPVAQRYTAELTQLLFTSTSMYKTQKLNLPLCFD